MRDFNTLDTQAFKAFWLASESLNFTEAAKKASMTQSGVSQHVARLEEQLGVSLFLRFNKRVLLTDAGKKFRTYVERYLDEIEALKEELNYEQYGLTGFVSYAMPESCLMSPHFGMLLGERKKHFPQLGLNVTICPSEEVIAKLIADEIHFGFVTKAFDTAGLKLTPFCKEQYILVGADKKKVSNITPEKLKDLLFIAHPGVETLFAHWRKTHFPKSRNLSWSSLNVIGKMGSLKGVIDMVQHDMGVTIIPAHCVTAQLNQKVLFQYRQRTPKSALNQIYLATLDHGQIPRRVETVIGTFLQFV